MQRVESRRDAIYMTHVFRRAAMIMQAKLATAILIKVIILISYDPFY